MRPLSQVPRSQKGVILVDRGEDVKKSRSVGVVGQGRAVLVELVLDQRLRNEAQYGVTVVKDLDTLQMSAHLRLPITLVRMGNQ